MTGIIAYPGGNLNTNDWKLRETLVKGENAMEKTRFRLTKGTAVLIIAVTAILLAAAVLVRGMPDGAQSGLRSLLDTSTADGREKYLSALGWEIDRSSEEAREVTLPAQFDGVMAQYNQLQLQQGFDLSAFAGQNCDQYTYRVTNYPGEDGVLVTLYVRGRQVIGGDIHSARMDGFMHTLTSVP